jgi:hypothetical protein
LLAVGDGRFYGSVIVVDPVTLVVAALAAGAGAGVKDAAAQGIRDAYAALRSLVLRRVAGTPGGEVAVRQHEADPGTWQAPVAKVVRESGAGEDAEVLEAAERLMTLLDPEGAAAGRYAATMNATSSGHGRVYQAGRDQHINEK